MEWLESEASGAIPGSSYLAPFPVEGRVINTLLKLVASPKLSVAKIGNSVGSGSKPWQPGRWTHSGVNLHCLRTDDVTSVGDGKFAI